MTAKDIGKRIQYLCEERHWTLYRLSRESGIPYTTLRSICYEDASPQMETVQKICNGFNLSLSAFFDDEGLPREDLSEAQRELVNKSDSFGNYEMGRILAYMDGMKEKEKK